MGPRTKPDRELLASGRPSDFGLFYDRHRSGVAAYVGKRTSQPDVAFDIVAETFARALEKRSQYDAERGPAIAWLFGIARNLIVDTARRGQVEADSRVRLGMPAIELDDEQLEWIAEAGRVDLRTALAAMSAEQREAVIRRVVLDEPYPVMAGNLLCSEQVVRKRVSRGLAALRADLEGRQ